MVLASSRVKSRSRSLALRGTRTATVKEATVKRFHYESHDQLRTHLADFMAAYNFARRLKTLSGLTPYEYIAKIWTHSQTGSSSIRSTRGRD
ncbi:transposase InsO family protein [Sphingomonas zeae]|jgi:transposase InsO family protein|nr:transposase InsO family protein [Sphingomonas zeae]